MDFKLIEKKLREIASKEGMSEYKISFMETANQSANAVDRELVGTETTQTSALCFTYINNERAGSSTTNLYDDESLYRLVLDAKDNQACLEGDTKAFLYTGKKEYASLKECVYQLPDFDKVIDKVMSLQLQMMDLEEKPESGSSTGIGSKKVRICLADSNGLSLEREYGYDTFAMDLVLSDGKESTDAWVYEARTLDEMNMPDLVSEAKAKLGATTTSTRKCPVIIKNECLIDFLSTFSNLFTAKSAQMGLSFFKDKEGQKVASDCVTLIDDPLDETLPKSFNFDAEGVPTFKKAVIENGVLKTLLYNQETAKKANKESTGNAGPFMGTISTVVFNFYIDKGDKSEEELLQMAQNGVYVNQMKGFHAGADPQTGDFSIDSEGFEIIDGKKAHSIKGFTVAGNFYDLLKNIEALSDKVYFSTPSSLGSFGCPTALVSGLSVAGV